jgi:hypothetical protein
MVQEKREYRKDNIVDGNALVETANSEHYANMHYCWIGRKRAGILRQLVYK